MFAWISVAALILGTTYAGDENKKPQLTLFYLSDVDGNYQPCGCQGNPTGGLARRTGVIEAYRKDHREADLQIDLGNLFKQPGPDSRPINDLLLENLTALPVVVVNLTPHDLHYWKTISDRTDLPTAFISTNLTPRRKSDPAPRRYAVVEVPPEKTGLRKTLRVGFLGVSDPALVKPNSGFRASDPAEAVARVKAEVLKSADILIVLADLPRRGNELGPQDMLHRLAQENPEVSAVLNTEKRYVLFPPQIVNNSVILSGVERGRQLSRLSLTLSDSGEVVEIDHEFYELKDGVPESLFWKRKQQEVEAKTSR